jgi:MraZ protein
VKRAFRGEITQKVDGKGRVSIPAKFCRVLEAGDPEWVEGKPAQLVIVHGHPNKTYVEGFSAEAIAAVQDRIARKPNGAKRKMLEFVYNAQSEDIAVDGSGRIVMPRAARAKLGLGGDGDVVFVGLGETFQIWRADDYAETHRAEMEAMLAALGDMEIDELLNDDAGSAP